MFSPAGRNLERGWPGRIEGDRVIQLAAQTLQSFFSGGGQAREHAEYPLDEVVFRAPILHPPSVRLFDGGDFAFANPAAIVGPDDLVPRPDGVERIEYELRPAAVVGAESAVGGLTLLNALTAPELAGAKARDFALALGPVLVTPDEPVARFEEVDWGRLISVAARNTRLVPGDVIAAEPLASGRADGVVELGVDGIGTLRNLIADG
jgi:2-keto-4-pentenoate hydratase/2-oxohepta-3-ene-1,7-dioic acid hydratase in catechol pathway